MVDYDVVTVDWDHEQTKVWRYHVEKHCQGANIITVPDTRPVPWCKMAGKVAAFYSQDLKHRAIYLDTDTIVTRDLAFVFDDMGDAKIAASSAIPQPPFSVGSGQGRKWYAKHMAADLFEPSMRQPTHFNTGMVAAVPGELWYMGSGTKTLLDHKAWAKAIRGYDLPDEVAFSYWLAVRYEEDQIYHLPLETHGNLTHGKVFFGEAKVPAVVHYHKPERLKQVGLYHLYEEALRHEV